MHSLAYLVDKETRARKTKLAHITELVMYVVERRMAERLYKQRQYVVEFFVAFTLRHVVVAFGMQILVEDLAQVSERELGIVI